MAKIDVNDKMRDFTFDTPFRKNVRLSEAAGGKKLALVFLRYYGCTLCQYDLSQYAKNYEKITAAGGELLVVLQSDPDLLREDMGKEDMFPFEIVCDPKEELYREFEILPAASKKDLAGLKTMVKVGKAMAAGFSHGRYEGDELQLPAAFILSPDLTVTYAHYAKVIDDVLDAEQIVDMMK
ncbi:peroxiredoxin [Lacrimispora xylanisolvens]|jgi:peroxiredoxin|uniref:Peroxiredoxin n=1 Tax=Lacrimispora xylanisolvens TaxID=384636 RepID=A0A2S6HYX1_9FIRM|nr:peroxiredoxin-like family protein [Hungatella xylanolytica]MBE5988735.1 AhpC/TSA family protein [Paenibacillaceae bacterium]PPK83361.1 peroxiredoxin [Hungatella xylanolytica]